MYSALSDISSAVQQTFAAAVTASTFTTSYVDLGAYNRGKFSVSVGAIGASSTITPTIQQATDTNGTGAKAVVFLNSVTIAAITASNTENTYNVSGQLLDVVNGFRYVNCSVVVGTASALVGVRFEGEPESTPPGLASFQKQVIL